MRSVVQGFVVLGVGLAFVGWAVAADLFVYPQKGQSAEQQNKDSYECYGWAKSQSGVDPGAPPPPAQAGQHARGAVGGAARGAALGAAVGAIGGDAGKGAAAGARWRRSNSNSRRRGARTTGRSPRAWKVAATPSAEPVLDANASRHRRQ